MENLQVPMCMKDLMQWDLALHISEETRGSKKNGVETVNYIKRKEIFTLQYI